MKNIKLTFATTLLLSIILSGTVLANGDDGDDNDKKDDEITLDLTTLLRLMFPSPLTKENDEVQGGEKPPIIEPQCQGFPICEDT